MIADIPNWVTGDILTPEEVYTAFKKGYMKKMPKRCKCNLEDMESCCDRSARTLFADKYYRKPSYNNLLLTYSEAKELFEIFMCFAKEWVRLYTEK